MTQRYNELGLLLSLAVILSPQTVTLGQDPQPLTAEQRQMFDEELRTLDESIAALRDGPRSDIADAAIFAKGLTWALRYDSKFSPKELALLQKAIVRGTQRTEALADDKKNVEHSPGQTRAGLRFSGG